MYIKLPKDMLDKLYLDFKDELRESEEFLDRAYDLHKHLYQDCEDCDEDDGCSKYYELKEEYDLEIMSTLGDLVMETRYWSKHDDADDNLDQGDIYHELLDSEFWSETYWNFVEKLDDDRDFDFRIMRKLLFTRE